MAPPRQPAPAPAPPPKRGWRLILYELIYEADTPAGKFFDLGLLVSILASVVAVCLESVTAVRAQHGGLLRGIEWFFTVAFTIEYILRLVSVRRPLRYATSFFGVVDLLSILPTWLSVFVPGAQGLLVIRTLRLLRVFRVLKLVRFIGEADVLWGAMKASARKITIFLGVVLSLALIAGTAMYLVEGEESGFSSIPQSMYWAIVTMTTVGYGDIAPQSVVGKFLASVLMILGYGIIAVPTGIVSAEMVAAPRPDRVSTQVCPECLREGHTRDALWCKYCRAELNPQAGASATPPPAP